MTAIALIPAKWHSSRCPGKNFNAFHGKPMLAYPIEASRASGLFSDFLVSVDDARMADLATSLGARPVWRDPKWNDLGTQELAAKVLADEDVHPERMACVIYATTPLITPNDLKMAFYAFDPVLDSFIMAVGTQPLADAGAFYAGLAGEFLDGAPLLSTHTRMFPLPPERVCDINTVEDWLRAHDMYAAMMAERERNRPRVGAV